MAERWSPSGGRAPWFGPLSPGGLVGGVAFGTCGCNSLVGSVGFCGCKGTGGTAVGRAAGAGFPVGPSDLAAGGVAAGGPPGLAWTAGGTTGGRGSGGLAEFA